MKLFADHVAEKHVNTLMREYSPSLHFVASLLSYILNYYDTFMMSKNDSFELVELIVNMYQRGSPTFRLLDCSPSILLPESKAHFCPNL